MHVARQACQTKVVASVLSCVILITTQVFESMKKRSLTSTGSAQVAVREKNKDNLIFSFIRIK